MGSNQIARSEMNTQDATVELEQDHQRIMERLARLVDFENASDDALVRQEWDSLEAHVLRHLDAEEMFLLPGFHRDRPGEAAAIRDQHALIRKRLGEIGIAVDLHLPRADQVSEFRDLLMSHVAEERRSLYVWARSKADEPSLRVLLRRIQQTIESDRAESALAGLLAACEDGEKGYRSAASDVADEGYKLMFRHYAEQRAGFAKALHNAARDLGVTTARAGSALGALHRSWLDLKAAIESGNPKAVLTECRRGEEAALKTYRDALRADLPPDARELVQQQYEAVKKARAEIVALLDAPGS
jgi:uncharacterized protein (TIGR02284 family)